MKKVISFVFVSLIFSLFIKAQNQKFVLSRQDSASYNLLIKKAEETKINGFLKQESDCYNKIATIWWEQNYFSKAAEYFNKSLVINNKLANANGIAMINSNLALIYADNGDYNKALLFFDKTLSIRKSRNEKTGIISARINMAVVLNNLKRYDESVKHLNSALDIAREMNDYTQMRSCYGMLSETYEKAGDNTKSMYYFNFYKKFNELVEGKKVKKANDFAKEQRLKKELAEKENKIKELELVKKDYELYSKERKLKKSESEKLSLLDTISEKDLKLIYVENQKKLEESKSKEVILKSKLWLRNIILFSSVILLTLFILVFFYIQKRKSNNILKAKNTEISQKNEEIQVQKNNIEELLIKTSEAHESIKKSINYASYIQKAMIDKSPYLSEYFPNSFILYKPKDIVGGDFYWYAEVDDKIVVAAVDCTGHGIPGAFLTVLGNNILNQIVSVSKITEPGEILKQLNLSVIASLNQNESENKDGMDIALCTIDKKQNKLYFAGANNPMVLIENDEMQIIKGNKYGIGGFSEMMFNRMKKKSGITLMYNTFEFDIHENMSIYLFSDGFQDQIGYKNQKKLKSNRFYELLKENNKQTSQTQKETLENFFETWRGNEEQVDDVIIIGIKF